MLFLLCNLNLMPTALAQTRGSITIAPKGDATASFLYKESHALLIGNTRYNDAGWPALPTIPKELAVIQKTLLAQGFIIYEDKVHLNLSERDLKGTLEDFIEDHGLDRENRLFIMYAGHGETLGDTGFLVPVDGATKRDEKAFRRGAISMDEIRAMIRKIQSKHVLFCFDSCFAGTIFRTRSGSAVPPDINLKTGKPVRQFLTAGGAGEEVPDASVFSAYLARGIEGEGDLDRDGFVTASELHVYLSKKVAAATARSTRNQVQFGKLPDPKFDEGDFVFDPGLRPRVGAATTSVAPKASAFAGTKAGEQKADNALGMKFQWCPPGTFTMGSPKSEDGRQDYEDQVRVELDGFWLGTYEVTQSEWKAVMGTSPSEFTGAKLPVEMVSWKDAVAYCRKLTASERASGRLPAGWMYALPSEAEWEYGCRAGTTTATAFGDSLSSRQANFNGGYPYGGAAEGPYLRKTMEVGSYRANGWGLYDLHGNVWEWCADLYIHELPGGKNPLVKEGIYRVDRGGSWRFSGEDCRSAGRNGSARGYWSKDLGLRVACVPSNPARK